MLTRHDLDRARCAMPGCQHEDHRELYLHARCHPRAGTIARYDMVKGSITILCHKCEKLVAEIAVAQE